MKLLLYFYPVDSDFVKSDYILLSKHYRIKKYYFKAHKKWLTPYFLICELLFLIWHIRSSSFLISQFSGYHSLLPSLFGRMLHRKHFIILHGTECHNFPEYKYGYLSKPTLFWFSKYSLRWAHQLLPVSQSLVRSEYTYMETKYKIQGYTSFYKNIITPYKIIHNGVDHNTFSIQDHIDRKPNSFISVSTGLHSSTRRAIKGIDLMIALARLTPQNHYTIVGSTLPVEIDIPDNLIVMPYVSNEELPLLYSAHMFYLQLSISEGFGIAVCEAMLCGCIPIVSHVGILPFIASSNGFVLPNKDLHQLLELVKVAALSFDPNLPLLVRRHVMDHFTSAFREQNLIQTLEN